MRLLGVNEEPVRYTGESIVNVHVNKVKHTVPTSQKVTSKT
jgi:hypothetical protein